MISSSPRVNLTIGYVAGNRARLEEAPTMTYDEAVEATVSREEALREIERHAETPMEAFEKWCEFLSEVGDRPEYQGSEVLGWLGY